MKRRLLMILAGAILSAGCGSGLTVKEEAGDLVAVGYGDGRLARFSKTGPVEIRGTVFQDPVNAVKLYAASHPAAAAVLMIDTAGVPPREEATAALERTLRNRTIYIFFTTSREMGRRLAALGPGNRLTLFGYELRHREIVEADGRVIEVRGFGDREAGESDAKFVLVTGLEVE